MPISLYFDTIFADSGDRVAVPDATQPSGAVSYTQGYSITYSTPVDSGGLDFPRAQHNQLLYDITAAIQNIQQNGAPPFITTAMNGGVDPFSYILGAIVAYDGGGGEQVWVSTAANNTTIPGGMGASWTPLQQSNSPLYIGGTSTGSANAQAVDTNQGDFTSAAGNLITFKAGISVSAAATLVIDGATALNLKVQTSTGLRDTISGDIVVGQEYLLSDDGTNLQILNPTPKNPTVQRVTASGALSVTPPTGITYATFKARGAGGGGAGTAAASLSAAGSGGEGAQLDIMLTAAQLGTSPITGTIGAGGAGGVAGTNNGTVGGDTVFGSFFTCHGGSPGQASAGAGGFAAGGAGGTISVSTGTVIDQRTGQTGGSGGNISLGVAGPGGGVNGAPFYSAGAGSGTGMNASGPGGGGGGAPSGANNSGTTQAGGVGGDGIIEIVWYYD